MREMNFAAFANKRINDIYKECFDKAIEYLRILPNNTINIEVEEDELSTHIISTQYGEDNELTYFNGIKYITKNDTKYIVLKTESSNTFDVYYGLRNGNQYTDNSFIIDILELIETIFKGYDNEVFTLAKEYNIDGTINIDVEVFDNLEKALSAMNYAKTEFQNMFGKNRELKVDDTTNENEMFIYAPSDDYTLDMKIETKKVK